jgi:iron complex transport system substrate-binding protein
VERVKPQRWNKLWHLASACAVLLALIMSGQTSARAEAERPQRIVSLNLCTDQLVMLLADKRQIAAISHLALDPQLAVLADEAQRLPITYGQAEEVYLLKPDLVVAGDFHLNATVDILRRLGIPVEEFAGSNSFADIRKNIRRMGRLLHAEQKAEKLIAAMDDKLARADERTGATKRLAALYYANSYTSGRSTLAAEVVERAGFQNLGSRLNLRGTAELSLESLIMARPDIVVTGLSYRAPALAQQVFKHPALTYLQNRTSAAAIPENLWICGTPFTADAVLALVDARKNLPALTASAAPTHLPAQIDRPSGDATIKSDSSRAAK